MKITEVRIKLMEEPGERLRAFCSITFDDCFVVRDLKIIEGTSGPFVAMPSRKLTAHCPKCGMKNHLRANHCNQCGNRLPEARAIKDVDGRAKLYADIAHPINSSCREMIQEHVVEAYREELEHAKSPNYVSRYDDFDAGDFDEPTTDVHRRIDTPESRQTTNRPHHPPQGDPPRPTPVVAPSAPAASRNSNPPAPHTKTSENRQSAFEDQGDFGAGIF